MTASILLIDADEAKMQRIEPVLAREGYRTDHVLPGEQAIHKVLIDRPDLVILGFDVRQEGWSFFNHLLTFVDQPLMLLLVSADERACVRALDLGADDCICKPISLVELAARVRALLRRGMPGDARERRSLFVDGDLMVDQARRSVHLGGQPVALTATEFKILCCLVCYAGEAVPHERLISQVWGPRHGQSSEILKPHIHHLRQKLEPDPHQPRRIVTCWGEGYMLKQIATGS